MSKKIACSAETANKIRDYYIKYLDVQNIVGKELVTIFAPVALPFVSKGQQIAKDGRLTAFDAVTKKFVREDEKEAYGADQEGLTEEESNELEGAITEVLQNYNEKKGGMAR